MYPGEANPQKGHKRRGAELTDTGCDPKNKDVLICSLNTLTANSLKSPTNRMSWEAAIR